MRYRFMTPRDLMLHEIPKLADEHGLGPDVGAHILPLTLDILEGRSCLFYLKAHTLNPNAARLSVRQATLNMRPVPIGERNGLRQVMELANAGNVPAEWQVVMGSVEALTNSN